MIKIDYSGIINTAIKAIVVSIILGIVTGAVAIVWNIVWTGVTTVDKRLLETETRLTASIEILAGEIAKIKAERPVVQEEFQVLSAPAEVDSVVSIPTITIPDVSKNDIIQRINTKQQMMLK